MTDRINIICNQESTTVTMPQDVRKMGAVSPQFLSLCLNMSNITSFHGNTQFKLTNIGATQTVPEGCYSLTTFNKYLESFDAPNLFYKLQKSTDGTHYDMCVYSTSTNRLNDVGRVVTITSLTSLPLLNSELYYGTVWHDYIYIECDLFHTHQNNNTNRAVLTRRELVPITVEPMQSMFYLFQDTIKYEYSGDTTISVRFYDRKQRPLTPIPENAPIFSIRFSEFSEPF